MINKEDSIIKTMMDAPFGERPESVEQYEIEEASYLTRIDCLLAGLVLGLSSSLIIFQVFMKLDTLI